MLDGKGEMHHSFEKGQPVVLTNPDVSGAVGWLVEWSVALPACWQGGCLDVWLVEFSSGCRLDGLLLAVGRLVYLRSVD